MGSDDNNPKGCCSSNSNSSDNPNTTRACCVARTTTAATTPPVSSSSACCASKSSSSCCNAPVAIATKVAEGVNDKEDGKDKEDAHHHHHDTHNTHEDQHGPDDSGVTTAACTSHHDHHAHHGHQHHAHETQQEDDHVSEDAPPLCLAVVREDGAHLVVYDAAGRPRLFSPQQSGGNPNSNMTSKKHDTRNYCFSSHGSSLLDDLLTPCFDEDGHHGVPDESCFCGLETPHLHAHLKDPKTCHEEQDATTCKKKKKSVKSDLGYLATQTLHPVEVSPASTDQEQEALLRINVSERMPNQCNSKEFQTHLAGLSHHSTMRHRRLRPISIQHDDHVDYLVHTAETGQLHLQHDCHDCGQSDVHGHFLPVGQRTLEGALQMHFYKVASRPFSILDYLQDVFAVESSDRVAAVENIMPQTMAAAAAAAKSDCCASGTCSKMAAMPTTTTTTTANNNKKNDHDDKDDKNAVVGKSHFFVKHICCASEIPAIHQIVDPLDGVVNVSMNTTTKMVYVEHVLSTVTAQAIADALNQQGFGAQVRQDAAAVVTTGQVWVQSILTVTTTLPETVPWQQQATSYLEGTFEASQLESFVVDAPNGTISLHHNAFSLSAQTVADGLVQAATTAPWQVHVSRDGADPKYWMGPVVDGGKDGGEDLDQDEAWTYPRPTVVLSGVFWIVSMLSLIGGNWEYLKYVALISIAFGIPPIALKAFKTLRRYQFDTNCLMFFAAVGAVALQDFAEAAAVVFLFAISEWLEVRATARARRALAAIVQLRPDRANLIHPSTKELMLVPAAAVPVGALVSVKTGDKIPCDGVVVEGTSTVDESSLTGESRPIKKVLHDKVAGGTVNSGMSPLTVRTTATADNSAVSRLIRLVEEAQANRSETEKLVDDFARIYTPIVVLAALLMCTIPWALGPDTGEKWTHNGLILIVVACPCALIISTPVSYVAGLAATAQKGILIKGGATLEALGMVKHVCFDKTGTLTNGEFALLDLVLVGSTLSRVQVLQYLSLMEEKASHPVAQAILMAANREKVTIPSDMHLENHTILAGEGVGGSVNNVTVHVGNERLFSRMGLLETVPKEILQKVEGWKALGGTVGFTSVEGHGIVCAYFAADGIREQSTRVVGNLKRAGIKVTMLTGDNEDAARAIGMQAGLSPDDIKARLLPEEKLRFIEALSEGQTNRSMFYNLCNGRELTLMCGDGVNDAPALAVANVGVAMGAGAALAMDTADATLLDSNIEKLEYSMRMGRRVIAKIKQNVIFSVVVKFAVLAMAIAGITHLWTAIAADVGCMILVTLNAMALLPRRQRSGDVQALKGDLEEAQGPLSGLVRGETGLSE